MFVSVRELPDSLRRVLAELKYGKADISVRAAESFTPAQGSGDGRRAFVSAVHIASGACKVEWGSWGGANMFNPRNAVDLDTRPQAIADGFAIVEGSEGGMRPVYASIVVGAAALALLLPAPAEVSERDRSILRIVRTYKGGAYRRAELDRIEATEAEVSSLVSRGLLSRNRAGAIAMTTAGKNAAGTSW